MDELAKECNARYAVLRASSCGAALTGLLVNHAQAIPVSSNEAIQPASATIGSEDQSAGSYFENLNTDQAIQLDGSST